MTAHQRIVRVRRNYNKWVANQTLEDYALRFTAKSARKWSSLRVANTAIGAVSFLALEAIGGSITINYGFVNASSAILVVGALIFLTSIPIAYYAATYGVDIDLLTRGAGFGYIGSTIVQPRPVRHCFDRRVLADRANRRAGRLPAVSSVARHTWRAELVGRLFV